ncbi:P22 phage major capsid protein family protein [Nocardia aurea]|uniref:P22 phage major capsid protein family protein n=2 Tax=Nocardia TaxID=1817 RepID=UPI000D693E2D|nr:P22 phage major capsid protein family protein [Nocardia aurea]
MANTLLTPSVIAKKALANLYENLVMVPLVYTDVSSEWGGQKIGSTVTIRKPATFTAQTFNPASPSITIQNATETSVAVTLDKHRDVSFAITAQDLTLRLEDFDEQLLAPACEALAQEVDKAIIAQAKADFTAFAGTGTGFEWNKPESLIEADRLLNIQKVPTSERSAVVGPTTRAGWLNSDLIKHADKAGDNAALRQGSIGNGIFGFNAFMTQNIVQPAGSPATGQPTTEVGLAFHKTALALASAPLALPRSNEWGAMESYKGLSLRIVSDYDMDLKSDVISVDILFGTKTLDANRGVLLRGALAS